MSERRRESRFAIDRMVNLSTDSDAIVHASGIDISRGGLLCATKTYLAPYTEVSLVVTLSTGTADRKVSIEGVIMRSEVETDAYLVGISFTSIDREARQILDDFLRGQPEREVGQ